MATPSAFAAEPAAPSLGQINRQLAEALKGAAATAAATAPAPAAAAAPAPSAPPRNAAPPSPAGAERGSASPGFRTVPVLKSSAGAANPREAEIDAAELQRLKARATVLDRLPNELTLHVGQMVLARAPDVVRVAVGSGKVLEARVVDNGSLLLTGQDAGESTLHVWDRSGKVSKLRVRVNTVDLDRISQELRELTAGIPGVSIVRISNRLVLDGANLDPGAVARLGELAKLYEPAVVSLATADRIRVDRMVDIQVRILEFTRNALDDLGMRWQSSGDGFNLGVFSDIASNGSFRILPQNSPFAQADGSTGAGMTELLNRKRRTPQYYLGLSTALSAQINLQVQRGNAFILASPNLSTRSGGEARFLAGGEIPLPAMSALGGGSVEFKPYGIRLDIKPMADGEGNISGSILTEVSSLDPSVAVQGIPGLLTRRTETEFNVFDGETIVISGLLNRESARASDGLPGLRKMPVVGRAFRADTESDRMQEVVVFLTPRVVSAADSAPRLQRARTIEEDVQRGFGDLTEDRSVPPKPRPVPPPADASALPAGQYDGP